jgi:uncharacterized protein (DUF1800 family)
MSTDEYRYAPAPPSPPPRDALISAELALASRLAPTPTALRRRDAKAMPPVRPYPDTAIPSARERLMMNRFAWGYSRDTMKEVNAAGGADAWFEQQLSPADLSDGPADEVDGWYDDRMRSAKAKWDDVFAERKSAWDYAVDLANWSLLRRTRSRRQLLDVMTDFWSNHFHVPSIHDLAWSWRNHYDQVIRRNAFGSFEDLLLETSLHPSMLLFLSNFESTKDAPNENQGRELLELHTVGRAAGYSEAMVKDSARILTGYTVRAWKSWMPRYDPDTHWTGHVKVLDFEHDNADPDGRQVANAYLRYLARHDSTARRLATKLAVRFVSDTPSPELIDHLAQTFKDSGTNIAATLRALVAHPEFAASADAKVRNPIEDFVATVRVLNVEAKRPKRSDGWPFAEAQIWMCKGQYPFMWPRPDGMPLDNDAWSSASQVLGSLDLHYSLSGGWVGDKGTAKYRGRESWLPRSQVRFDAFVDHLSRLLLGRESTPRLLKAACQATGCEPAEKINKSHALVQWLMPRLLTALLDTPAHLSR